MKPDADAIRHALSVARQKGFRRVQLSVEGGSFRATLGEPDYEDFDDEVEEFEDEPAAESGPAPKRSAPPSSGT